MSNCLHEACCRLSFTVIRRSSLHADENVVQTLERITKLRSIYSWLSAPRRIMNWQRAHVCMSRHRATSCWTKAANKCNANGNSMTIATAGKSYSQLNLCTLMIVVLKTSFYITTFCIWLRQSIDEALDITVGGALLPDESSGSGCH